MDGSSDILVFLGRIHPLVVHFPIGFLLLVSFLELAANRPKYEPLKGYTKYLWGLSSISAFVSVLFGYFLSLSGDYNESTLFWHKWSAIILFILSSSVYVILKKQIKIPYKGKNVFVFIIVILVFYTGHLGGNLTHGSTYLLEYAPNMVRKMAGMPPKVVPRKRVTILDSADVYLDIIAPIMDNRCVSCHNNDKKKGGLDLTSYANMMKGGDDGESIVFGDPTSSEIYRRITLPETHDDFMPTEGKIPLSSDEIEFIALWIKNKAPSSGYVTSLNLDDTIKNKIEKYLGLDKNTLLSKELEPPQKEVIDSLVNHGFVLNQLMKDNYFLEANFSLSERELVARSLEFLVNIKEQLIWLNISNSRVKDQDLEKIGELKNLIKLNLSKNAITDKGLIHLEKLENLEVLNLYRTNVSDGVLSLIPKLINLKRLYISESKVDSKELALIKKENKKLNIVFD